MGFASAFDYGFIVLNLFYVLSKLGPLITWFLSYLDLVHLVDYGEQERCPTKAATLQMIKTTIPVVEFGCLLHRVEESDQEETVCAVCLCSIERKQKVRELCNCKHVFHKRCLDKWVDQAQQTCPLCRSTLLPHWACRLDVDDSSWLIDRISYLLGEDLLS